MASILRDLIEPRPWFDFPHPIGFHEPEWFVERLRRGWDRACRDAALNDRVEELHAARDEYARLFQAYELVLKGWLTLLEVHRNAFGSEVPPLEHLGKALESFQQLRLDVFTGWDTLDDLYGKLMPYVTLPNDRLMELAAKNPPPASFYEEPPASSTTE